MLLPNIPLLSDNELAEWVADRVKNEYKEDVICDYKANFNLTNKGAKKELVKDIVGFANEVGGVVLLGVPEKVDGGGNTGIPNQIYGLEEESDRTLDIFNVLRDGSSPALPALHVRRILVSEKKFIYVLYHPQSWARPHMVSVDGVNRYYKRSVESTVGMHEHEIEALYNLKRISRERVKEYVDGIDYGEKIFLSSGKSFRSFFKVLYLPIPMRDDFLSFRSGVGLKIANDTFMFPGGGNAWLPCRDGIISHDNHDVTQSNRIVKHHYSGAFTHIEGASFTNEDKLFIEDIASHMYSNGIMRHLKKYFNELNYNGDVLVRGELGNLMPAQLTAGDGRGTPVPAYFQDTTLVIEIVIASNLFIEDQAGVKEIIKNSLANLIGLWRS